MLARGTHRVARLLSRRHLYDSYVHRKIRRAAAVYEQVGTGARQRVVFRKELGAIPAAAIMKSSRMRVLLISTYDLGHQPFGLASPAAWLAERGHQVACTDLCVESLDSDTVREADFVAFYLPMHTATRLAAKVNEKVRRL